MKRERSRSLPLQRLTLVRCPLAAMVALALHVALIPAAASAAREDFCLFDPTVTVEVGGKPVAVQVWLGAPREAIARVDQRVTSGTLQARVREAGGQTEIVVSIVVVTRGGSSFPVTAALSVPALGLRSDPVAGQSGEELVNSLRLPSP